MNKEETEREMTEKLQRANRIVQNYKKLRVKHKVLLELLKINMMETDLHSQTLTAMVFFTLGRRERHRKL